MTKIRKKSYLFFFKLINEVLRIKALPFFHVTHLGRDLISFSFSLVPSLHTYPFVFPLIFLVLWSFFWTSADPPEGRQGREKKLISQYYDSTGLHGTNRECFLCFLLLHSDQLYRTHLHDLVYVKEMFLTVIFMLQNVSRLTKATIKIPYVSTFVPHISPSS